MLERWTQKNRSKTPGNSSIAENSPLNIFFVAELNKLAPNSVPPIAPEPKWVS